jgi:hypothetical protein
LERNKNIFDKIGSLIPGYAGYADRDSRRNCDKLLRNEIAKEILGNESVINEKIKQEVKDKNFDALQDLEERRQSLRSLSEKIKYAPYGESSFFSDTQIKEGELKKIYQFDDKLLSLLKITKQKLVDMSIDEIDVHIASIISSIEERNTFIKERK